MIKKKKGFTLIELIAAIAIVTIALATIASAMLYAKAAEKKASVKLDTAFYEKGIVEMLRAQNFARVESLANLGKVYLFYDNVTALQDNFYDYALAGTEDVNALKDIIKIDSSITSGDYADCTAVNTFNNKRRYGSALIIAKDTSLSNIENSLYIVKLWTWDFKYGERSMMYREFYISR